MSSPGDGIWIQLCNGSEDVALAGHARDSAEVVTAQGLWGGASVRGIHNDTYAGTVRDYQT